MLLTRSAMFSNGRIYCSLRQLLVPPSTLRTTQVQRLARSFYILLATGATSKNGSDKIPLPQALAKPNQKESHNSKENVSYCSKNHALPRPVARLGLPVHLRREDRPDRIRDERNKYVAQQQRTRNRALDFQRINPNKKTDKHPRTEIL